MTTAGGRSIAHVLYSFGVGGQERVVLDLVAAQCAAGFSVHAIALSAPVDGDLGPEFSARGARVDRVVKRGGFDPTMVPRLGALFRKRRVDLVHTHNPMPLIYGAPAARMVRLPVVHTKHGEHRDSRVRMAMRKAAARCTSVFVAVSDTTAAFASEHRECDPGKLRVIQNGTDLSRFGREPAARAAIRRELGIPESAFVFGSVGRFVPEKDQASLFAAAEPLLGEQVHLVVAGDGPDLAAFKEQVAASPASSFVHILGRRTDVPELLASFDLFVISSRTEGLPVVLLEAMASELAVLSTAVGGIPQVITDGDTGYLVPSGSREALSRRMAELHAQAEAVAAVAERGRAAALAGFSAERMHEQYLALYDEVLRNS